MTDLNKLYQNIILYDKVAQFILVTTVAYLKWIISQSIGASPALLSKSHQVSETIYTAILNFS